MISFFRKIRQKLLSQNRITRYLIYALGEIFLVVIGILIALQVNNWNEERKDRIKSLSYHERILEDLDIFISETDQAIRRSTSIRNLIVETIGILESKKLTEEKFRLFERTLHLYYQIPYRNPSLTSLAEMRSNGDLNQIRNLDLRKKLIQMEQEILSTDEVLVQIGYQTQEPVFYVDQYVRYLPDTTSISTNGVRINVDADFEAMANDKKLINYFSKFSVQWSHHLMFTKSLNESALELRKDLIRELENIQ